jgi:hypothetical protein
VVSLWPLVCVAGLSYGRVSVWCRRRTRRFGWTVADVVLHLAQTEEAVVAAAAEDAEG